MFFAKSNFKNGAFPSQKSTSARQVGHRDGVVPPGTRYRILLIDLVHKDRAAGGQESGINAPLVSE